MPVPTTFLELTAILELRNRISKPSRRGIMRNKAIYLATLLCVPLAAALIANAPVAAAADTGTSPAATADITASSPAAAADNTGTSPVCFPADDVRTAQQAGDVHSACG
jgi:hypothetical protein